MRLEYFEGSSFLHRADVRSKLLAFVVIIVTSFLFVNPIPNLVLTALAILLLLRVGLKPTEVFSLFAPLLLVVVLIFLFAIFSPPSGSSKEIAFLLWPNGPGITYGGLLYGSSLALRILMMISYTALFVLTTPIEQFSTLLQRHKVPHFLVFIFMTALRFIPTMQTRSDQILDAQKARGARVDSSGLFTRIKSFVTIMVPLFSTGIRMSEDLAASMVSRGYGVVPHPTILHDLTFSWRDALILVLAISLIFVGIFSRATGIL